MERIILALSTCFLFISCGKDPAKTLRGEIKKRGYILYQNPLSYSGTGTLVGGRPSMMQIVSAPETCFPDEIEGQKTGLRKTDNANLPSSYTRTTFGFGVGVGMLEILGNGNGVIQFGADMSNDIEITVEYEGATVEYIDAVKLKKHYDEVMSQTCKDFLDVTGYITQALRVEKMRFSFRSAKSGKVDLSIGGFLGGSVTPNANVNWYLEDRYTLTIDTPKYIGYQLGKLRLEDEGYSLARSTKINKKEDRYIWETLSVFEEDPKRTGREMVQYDDEFLVPYRDIKEVR